jgi:hypothetical protein
MRQPEGVTLRVTVLEQTKVLLEALEAIVLRERRAIVSLDREALLSLEEERQATIEALELLRQETSLPSPAASVSSPALDTLRNEIRAQTKRLMLQAEANRILLIDALDALQELRGLRTPVTSTYDAKARVRAQSISYVEKSV